MSHDQDGLIQQIEISEVRSGRATLSFILDSSGFLKLCGAQPQKLSFAVYEEHVFHQKPRKTKNQKNRIFLEYFGMM